MADLDLRWTDEDGATALFTTDPETCGDDDAIAVMAVLGNTSSGGVYIKPRDARALISFLESALRMGGQPVGVAEAAALQGEGQDG